jgi:hypothetical protein
MVLGTPSLVHAGIDGVLATGSRVLGVGRQCGGGVVERSSRGGRRGRGRRDTAAQAGRCSADVGVGAVSRVWERVRVRVCVAMECGRRWRGQRKPRQTIMLDKDKCRRTEERKTETGQGQRTGPPPYDCRQPCSGSY